MSVLIRTLFPSAMYEIGRSEALDLMILTLNDVILSLQSPDTPLDPETRQAAVNDVTRQIADLEAFRDTQGAKGGRDTPPRQLE